MPVALYTRLDAKASASLGLGLVLVEQNLKLEGATFEVAAISPGSLADAQNQEQGASYEPLARGDRITMVNGYFEYQAMREELRSSLSLTIRFIRVPRAAPMSAGNKFGGDQRCDLCTRHTWPYHDWCASCLSVRWTRSMLRLVPIHEFTRVNTRVEEMVIIFSYVGRDYHGRVWTAYLHHTLVACGSPFREFKYFYNGMAGNISETQDILTLILEFVTGDETDGMGSW